MSRRNRSATVGGEISRPPTSLLGGLSANPAGIDENSQGIVQENAFGGNSSLGLKRFGGFEDLNNQLARRPDKETLVERNILKPDNVSSRIAQQAEILKRNMLEDHLNSKLSSRPEERDLRDHNILKPEANLSGPLQVRLCEVGASMDMSNE
ncbi:hypothetical protein HK102_013264 [Quaeritorhiza haematococci]|nr:hypothetical protein HK102_013264 [Quaeritorhiza haematococci]